MNNVKAIKEIFTEGAFFTIACKSRLVAAMMRISTFMADGRQSVQIPVPAECVVIWLQYERHFANFVEEQSTFVGTLNNP